VPLAFHVDYFNTPWKDRFSDPSHSRRELAYNQALKRDDLYFTPMLMVDGRYPMLGTDQPKAQAALRRAASDKPGASIDASLKPDGQGNRKKTLDVSVVPPGGRELLVGVALFEDPVSTHVLSGENAGKTLVERFAVRKFVWERVSADRAKAKAPLAFSFPLETAADWDSARCGVAVWVQDWNDGRVYQAEALRWSEPGVKREAVSGTNRGK
jgi:hypothetical protein